MRRLKLFFACLLMAVLSIGQMWATDVTFSYGDYTGKGGPSGSGSEYTMSDKDDVSITNTKFYGNNSYAHFYASGTTTITPAANVTITGITLTASATNNNGFQSNGTVTASTGTVSGSSTSTTVTWSGSASSAFTISNNKQIRWTSIVVTYTKGSGNNPGTNPGEDPDPTDDADVTLDLTSNTAWGFPQGSANKTVAEGSYSDGTYTIKVAGSTGQGFYYNTSGYLLLGKTGAYIELPAFTSPVEKIALVGTSGGSESVSYNVFDGETKVKTTDAVGCKNVTAEFEIANPTANKVYTIKVTGNANLQLSAIKIYYVAAADVAAPSVTASGKFVDAKEVSMSCSTEGATIYYTTNGSTPTSTSTPYTAAFNVEETTTIKAIAILGASSSAVTERVYTKVTPLTTMAEVHSAMPTDGNATIDVTITDWIVTGAKDGQSQVWFTNADNTKGILLYKSGHGFVAGKKISGTVFDATITIFNGGPELTTLTASQFNVTDAPEITPAVVTIADLNTNFPADQGRVVKLENVTYNGSAFTDETNSITIDSRFLNGNPTLINGSKYNLTGVVYYGSEVKKIMPREAADIEKLDDTSLTEVTGLANLKAAAKGSYLVNLSNAVVTLVDGNNAFIEDATAGALIYFNNHGYQAGDCLNGKYEVTTADYKGKFEITAMNAQTGAEKTTAAIPVTTLTIAQLSADFAAYESMRIKIESVTVTDAIANNDRNGVISDGANTCILYAGKNGVAAAENAYVNIIAYPTLYKNEDDPVINQFSVWAQSDITVIDREDPELVYNPTEVNLTLDNLAAFTPAVLDYATGFDGVAAITYESSDLSIATVGETTGVVEIVATAEGSAVITATFGGNATYNPDHASYTINVGAAAAPSFAYYNYVKVTETSAIEDGEYLIVYEAENVAFNGGLDALDAAHNTIAVTIDEGVIESNATTDAASFTIDVTNGTIRAHMGDYIGVTSYGNGLKQNENVETYPAHSFSINGDGDAVISIYGATWNKGDEGTMILNYNSNANDKRFRYYKEGSQHLIQLYKKVGTNEAPKADPQLAWDPADDIVLTVDDEFTAPTLTYAQGFDGLEAVVITSSNTALAQVNAGVVSLVAEATGEATITATFAGNDNYKAATASYKITVNAVAPTPAETKNVVILAEYNSKFYAMTNSLASGALAAVEVEKDGDKIVVFAEADKAAIQWTMTDNTTTATFQDSEDKYLAHTGTGTSLALQDAAEDWTWDSENGCYYMVVDSKDRAFMYYKDGIFKNYATSNLAPDKTDYSGAPEIIEIAAEDIILSQKADAELAYDPAEVTLTVGGEFTPAALTYAEGFDGLAAVTYASSNEAVATVDENSGVVSLVADAIGTTTITATFAGNNNYLQGSASYVITVNEAGDDLTGTWVRASSVAAGDKFIVVGSYNNKTMAMGKQNSNNRAAVASSVDEWNVLTPGAGTKVFTLVDAGEGKFAIQASNGKYLSAAGTGTNNYLREAADYEADNAKWTISIENGIASVVASSNNRNVMRYNSTNNSELFSCYQSGAQRDIQIFKLGTPDYGSYQRNVTNGNYGTICLPKAGTISGATLFEIADYDGSMIYVDEVLNGAMEAGKPYIFQATSEQLNVTYTSSAVEETAGNANGLHGFYDLNDEEATLPLANDASLGNYILYQNAYWLVSGRAAVIANYRAYIKIGEINAQTAAPGRRRVAMAVNGEQVATGMESIQPSEVSIQKVMIDGKLFIIRGEKMYNVNGQVVK